MMKDLVEKWFHLWASGDYQSLPLSDDFSHTSPFGTIESKKAYLDLVAENEDKFTGYEFILHDQIFEDHRACVRYTAVQGEDFKLDVSEWYYPGSDGQIGKIIAYYHIGDIREERELKG